MQSLPIKAPVGIMITTFELVQGKANPTLSHIFWGETLQQAIGNAKAHLLTDYFFSSSFVGQMEWHGSMLYLSNAGELLANIQLTSQVDINQLLSSLARNAQYINNAQYNSGMVQLIERISQSQT